MPWSPGVSLRVKAVKVLEEMTSFLTQFLAFIILSLGEILSKTDQQNQCFMTTNINTTIVILKEMWKLCIRAAGAIFFLMCMIQITLMGTTDMAC